MADDDGRQISGTGFVWFVEAAGREARPLQRLAQ